MQRNKKDTYGPLLDTRNKATAFAVCLLAAALLIIVFFMTVEQRTSAVFPDCLLRTATGIRCFLCGGTRCAREIISFDFAKAIYYNPYVVVCVLSAAVWYILLVISIFRKVYKPLRMSEAYLWCVLAGALLFTAVRNLDFYKNIFY